MVEMSFSHLGRHPLLPTSPAFTTSRRHLEAFCSTGMSVVGESAAYPSLPDMAWKRDPPGALFSSPAYFLYRLFLGYHSFQPQSLFWFLSPPLCPECLEFGWTIPHLVSVILAPGKHPQTLDSIHHRLISPPLLAPLPLSGSPVPPCLFINHTSFILTIHHRKFNSSSLHQPCCP